MSKNVKKSELLEALTILKQSFIVVGFFSFFINILMLVPPLYMLQIYDRVLASRSEETLIVLTFIVVVMFITMGLLEFVRSRILVRLGNRIDMHFSSRIFDVLFELANKYPGKASTQAISDMTHIRQFMTGNGLFAFFDAPWLPIYIFVLYLFHPLFALFGITAAVVLFIIAILNEFNTRKNIEEANEMSQKSIRFANNNLRNSEVINALGMIGNIKNRWLERHINFLALQSDASDKAGKWTNLSKVMRMGFQSLILGLGGYLAIQSEISAGMMIAGSIILGRALSPLDLLINSWKGFVSAREGYNRLNILFGEFPLKEKPMPLPDPIGNISLENITVIPPEGEQPSIRGLNMKINAGEIIGVIGPTAAGKSTLARATLGVWPLVNGKVRIDGAELKQWDREVLGKFIGYLPQDIELFEGTISENIERFGEKNPEAVVEAAKKASVHEMILHLPHGYDTLVGVGGTTLSAGQRQRIGLARALYNNPIFIVLDEPNSNLDEVGEKALLLAIIKLKKEGTTVMLITHRPNILGITDKIAVLAEGELKMYGKRDEILSKLTSKKTLKPSSSQAKSGEG
ncbi:MAG: type I secretion system permease/ATPase [Sulfurimonas sp.]|nr:type I secretion system permease/ATPase [Sulfurimonas sp.]